MKFQDIKVRDVRMLSLADDKITAVLPKDRIEIFTFNNRAEMEEALRQWAAIPDAEKPDL